MKKFLQSLVLIVTVLFFTSNVFAISYGLFDDPHNSMVQCWTSDDIRDLFAIDPAGHQLQSLLLPTGAYGTVTFGGKAVLECINCACHQVGPSGAYVLPDGTQTFSWSAAELGWTYHVHITNYFDGICYGVVTDYIGNAIMVGYSVDGITWIFGEVI